MKILNVSSIIPLEGLKRENDIVLRIQDHLTKEYSYEFIIAKSLPYAPKVLGLFSKKWKYYHQYIKQGKTQIQGYKAFIYPWLMAPTSNLWVNYFLIPINLIYFNLFLKKNLIDFDQNYDIILAQNNIPDAIVAYLLSKQTNHPYILNTRGDFSSIVLNLPFLKHVYKYANKIITHSPQNFMKLEKTTNIKLLPHPIESFFFDNKIKSTDKPIVLISVCRLLKLKHLDWVINALVDIKTEKNQFIYNIIGDGPELENLKHLVQKKRLENNVKFHGHKSHLEVNEHLRNSHIFIMPSYPETLGRSFLEAAAANCIIIGHKSTGVDGLLKHKESGIFVDKNSIQDELKNIFDSFSDDHFRYYTNNAQRIVADLTWERIGKIYNELYRSAN
jgi:glycosyltransferase involved in cell wall biosynthesis